MGKNKSDDKSRLIAVLEDPQVQGKIREILGIDGSRNSVCDAKDVSGSRLADGAEMQALRDELKSKQKEIERLNQDLAKARDSFSVSEKKRKEADSAAAKAKKDLDESLSRLKKADRELKSLRASISEFDEMFECYRSLPSALRKNLKGFFNDSDLRSFVITGVQSENLKGFWEYCKNDLVRGRLLAERESLLRIFKFFFDLINESQGDRPQWILQEVKPGTVFDTSCFSATPESEVAGRVSEVLWPGMLYANKKVFRKSLVVVK